MKPFSWNTRKVARSPFRTLERAKKAERDYWASKVGPAHARASKVGPAHARACKSIGFTARSSLKSMGRIPRASGNYVLGKKYRRFN